ncbi:MULTISPECIES: hypothetical protein [Alteromonadaceae]|jgi:hypothetical protein|uniref:Uncharacterized protein n=1 Tax=Brumicola blandensis TaxID=3075611 RepID=A0AAW8R945_9ALTE|nr:MULTISPECIES: hypothetical protein [unclassified Alteromonas]MDT0583708.1 hypothetical protein [Alteromonas sp. W409]MDT0629167.1 hypothetical protein [Alteromonas sp. W364]
MSSLIDKITTEPLRHWQRFIKGFCVFMVGVAIWYSDMGISYFNIFDGISDTFINSTKIVALVFLTIGACMSIYGYVQILICRLLPSRVAKQSEEA